MTLPTSMTHEERQNLREAALCALRAAENRWRQLHEGMPSKMRSTDWELQTSNSFRRIGTALGDGDVLCGTIHPRDRHPDLLAPSGVLEYIVAAQPSAVLKLLDQLDAAEQLLSRLAEVEARLDETDRRFRETQILVDQLRAAVPEVQR